jgi:protein-disulfide isomerase
MSSAVLARVNVVLAFAGLFIASMLSLSHLLDIHLPCGTGSGCDLVTQDPRSQLLGIPFAYYGLAGYTLMACIALVRVFAPGYKPRVLHNAGYLLSLLGLLISIALTAFSIRSIHALCTWCIASAVTMSLLFVSHSLGAMREQSSARARAALDGLWIVVLGCTVLAGLVTAAVDLKAEAKTVHVNRAALKELDESELLPEEAHITGPRTAKATVVMFGDLTCPVCREAFLDITELMRRRHDFRFAFRQLPLSFHPFARPAALISEMAGEKGRFWDFASACYNGDPDGDAQLLDLAARVGLDPAKVKNRLNDASDPAAEILERDAAVTVKLGLHSTPSVFILIDGYYPEPIAYRGIETMLDNNTAEKRHG